MEDPKWLRLITIGLILAALAVGYFLLTGRFNSTSTKKPSQTSKPSQQVQLTQPSPPPSVLGTSDSRSSAPTSISGTTKGGVSTLPNTGFPISLALTFATSALFAGFGLRKYPN